MSFTLDGVSLKGSDGVDTVSLAVGGDDAAVTYIGAQKDNDSVASTRNFGSVTTQGDIRMGAGDDTVTLEAEFYGSLRGGSGNDVLDLSHAHDSWITGNKGDDDITISVEVSGSNVAGGADNDDLHILGNATNSEFIGGEGDDLIEILGEENAGVTINGGLGKDLITVASGATHFDYVLGDSNVADNAWDVITGFVPKEGNGANATVVDVLDFEVAGTRENFVTINRKADDIEAALGFAQDELVAKGNKEAPIYVFVDDIRDTGSSALFADLDQDGTLETAIEFTKAEGSNFGPYLTYANVI